MQDEILSFMDLLDLDEELIDNRLRVLMNRTSYDVKHLRNALHLLEYKLLINLQENADCDNTEECHFLIKLFAQSQEGNIDYVCKITNIVLSLHPPSLLAKSEHILQQILPYLFETGETYFDKEFGAILIKLRICGSILEQVIKSGQKVSLLFLDTPLVQLLFDLNNEKLMYYFIMNTVPLFIDGVFEYNILNQLWEYVQNLNNDKYFKALRIITMLSEYFLPIPQNSDKKIKYESKVVFERKFWEIILFGMKSDDAYHRKTSIYLMKRVIDYVKTFKINIEIKSDNSVLFTWNSMDEKNYEQSWNKYFILFESLEQKQLNIIQPNLTLLSYVKENGREWHNCVFKLGLIHDNAKVRETCLFYLDSIQSVEEATMMLNALNSISSLEFKDSNNLKIINLKEIYSDKESFLNIITAIPIINWSPVPLFYVVSQMNCMEVEKLSLYSLSFDHKQIVKIFCNILKIPCNNVVVRKKAHMYIFKIFSYLCRRIDCQDFAILWSTMQIESVQNSELKLLMVPWFAQVTLDNEQEFFNFLISTYTAPLLISVFLDKVDKHGEYVTQIEKQIQLIRSIASRQYSEKTSCFKDFVYLLALYDENVNECNTLKKIQAIIDSKSLVQYLICLVLEDTILNLDDMLSCLHNCKKLLTTDNCNLKDDLLKLNFICFKIIQEQCDIQKKVVAINILKIILNNTFIPISQTVQVKDIIRATKTLGSKDERSGKSYGRLQNNYYETSCEIINKLMSFNEAIISNIQVILEFVESVIDCGGYGCLKWILCIMNKALPLMDTNKVTYDMEKFIDKIWKEIEELKSNYQYVPCMKEFIRLITQDAILKKALHDKSVIFYCRKILEHGDVTPAPLLYLINAIKLLEITIDLKNIVIVLEEILLFAPVKRKDQRKLNDTVAYILNECEGIVKNGPTEKYPFTSTIQAVAIQTLLNIKDEAVFKHILKYFNETISSMYKNNKRLYFANSVVHRKIIIALQHMIFIVLINARSTDVAEVLPWAVAFLSDLPHEQSVKVYLEWYISLIIYNARIPVDNKLMNSYNFSNLPQNSISTIIYFVMRQKIIDHNFEMNEYHFVMNYLLSLTMGPTFSVRAYAQYMASKLFTMVDCTVSAIYSYTNKLILDTMKQGCKEKLYKSISKDYFISQTDIINTLTPICIYSYSAQFYGVIFDKFYALPSIADCERYIERNKIRSHILSTWAECTKTGDDIEFTDIDQDKEDKDCGQFQNHGLVQTKYLPWTDMTDIDVCAVKPKRECPSELIIVASLIDKIPNLGGLVRTCEVFGVRSCVINNSRIVQDKQFQSLSVSAESWVDLQEVRPGKSLKEYLQKMKLEGYCIVAAEQTSGSVPLQTFKFDKKTLLLLGHEKEGVPYDLLPLMDQCVEIPQQGVIRSLNVHVTAAIFVWEYCRQQLL